LTRSTSWPPQLSFFKEGIFFYSKLIFLLTNQAFFLLYLLDLFDTEHKLAPKDPVFRARFYKLIFYCSGTVDNLTATSSPLQITLDDPMPGQKAEIIAQNKKAYRYFFMTLVTLWTM